MATTTPKAPSFDREDELYQRLRQRLNNNSSPFGIGSITPEELAHFKSKLEPMAYAELVKEFSPSVGMEFFRDAGKIEENLAEKGFFTRGLNSFNAELSDFASTDRDDDNIIERTVRGAANIPYWATKGVQTGGFGIHDAFNDDEDHLDTGDFFDRSLETLGAFAKPVQLGGTLLNQGKNLLGKAIKNPKKLMSPGALWRGVKNNKTAMGVGGGIAAASSMDGTDIPMSEVPGLDDAEETEVSLDSPAATPYGGSAEAGAQPDLSNPAGLAAIANNMGNFRPIDPKDKSLDAFQRRGIQQDLMAQAGRTVKQDIANQRRADRAAEDAAFENMKEQAIAKAWMNSPTNKEGIPFDQLTPAKQAEMRRNYMASKYYSSEDDRKRRLAQELKASGGYGVGEIGGGMTMDEFKKKSGMQNEGTSIIQNPDGTFSTNETKEAFDRAGGRDSALNVFNELGNNGAKEANLDHQLGGDRSVTGRDGQELAGLTPGSVRMSSNESDYGDARFNSREDALKYLNRKPVSEPETPQTQEDDEMNPLLKYGLPIAGGAALLHPATRKKGAEMIKRGLNVFKKAPPPAAKNPWTSTAGGYTGKTPEQLGRAAANAPKSMSNPWTSSVGGYTGGTPEQVGRAAQAAQAATKSNPWTSNVGGYTGRTPQDLGRAVNNAPKSMNNPWTSNVGGYTGRTPQDLGRAANIPPKVTPETPWVSSANMRPPARTPQDVGVANRPAPQSPWSSTSNMQTPKPPAVTPQDIGRASAPAPQTPWSSARNTRPASPPAVTPQDIGMGNRAAPMSPWASSRNVRPQTPQAPAATPQSVGAANRQAAEMKQVNDYVDNIADADYAVALKRLGLGKNVSRQQLKDILGKTSFGRLSLDNL
jgi:hypothetical protein